MGNGEYTITYKLKGYDASLRSKTIIKRDDIENVTIYTDALTCDSIDIYKNNGTSGFMSSTITVQIGGENGLMYKKYHAELFDTAYQKVNDGIDLSVTAEYNVQWTDMATWRSCFLVREATDEKITFVSGAANIRIVQRAIIELVRLTVEAGLDYKDITWYQAQYFIFNMSTKTAPVPELIDSNTAEAWLLENKKAAVDFYLENK